MRSFKDSELVITKGIHDRMEDEEFAVGVLDSLRRYVNGDWGNLCDSDKAENEKALRDGERIFAVYNIGNEKIYIITEWDCSITTVLLPEEY